MHNGDIWTGRCWLDRRTDDPLISAQFFPTSPPGQAWFPGERSRLLVRRCPASQEELSIITVHFLFFRTEFAA